MCAQKQRTPGTPRFSPTRLALYRFCPKAYHYYYVQGLRWGQMTAGHAFGGTLHRTLEEFHREGAQADLSALLETYRARWIEKGYSDADEAARHFQAGEELLRRYHTEAVETGRETIAVETTLRVDYPGFALFGKIDRLDRLADGELQVIDYKSGRLTVTEEEVRASPALAIYQLLVARRYPGASVSAAILCLRSGEIASVRRSPAELEGVETDVSALVATILAEESFAPTPGPHCKTCSFFRICPAADRSP
jgi:DNA helicase-2/ATP-dependent DNA helicase PcrA